MNIEPHTHPYFPKQCVDLFEETAGFFNKRKHICPRARYDYTLKEMEIWRRTTAVDNQYLHTNLTVKVLWVDSPGPDSDPGLEMTKIGSINVHPTATKPENSSTPISLTPNLQIMISIPRLSLNPQSSYHILIHLPRQNSSTAQLGCST